ncbi:hypothetical protein AB0L64_17595 [Kribbella sp. NPDC051936]|uniref:hypothetical protein n=1 Tax=Kribbella sp. NPDC051936 TaxID=3154946 RepID=UPI0034272EAF
MHDAEVLPQPDCHADQRRGNFAIACPEQLALAYSRHLYNAAMPFPLVTEKATPASRQAFLIDTFNGSRATLTLSLQRANLAACTTSTVLVTDTPALTRRRNERRGQACDISCDETPVNSGRVLPGTDLTRDGATE